MVSSDAITNCRYCSYCVFAARYCCCCCIFAKLGVSREHGLVSRNDLWCTGPSPCTAEDLPSSSFCYACRAAQYTSFAFALAAPKVSMSSRSQHVITRPEEVISHTRPEVISQHVITIAACHHSSRSSRHFACMLILAARPFRAQHNILFSFIPLSFAAHPLRSPISFYAQNGCSKKNREKTRTC